jgi:Mg-chelatase subunit ChlD/triacylglycerol esterase/lipase EstA (alpha/beta hydrolase family)
MIFCFASSLFWFGSTAFAANTALIPLSSDNGKKIPLILIHGIHGTPKNSDVTVKQNYWNEFLESYYKDPRLAENYIVYLFQYQSDLISVKDIAFALGHAIDSQIVNRPHVILAHSMGGLVAKNYLAYYRHTSGAWRGKIGGDSVLSLITLATPHHGTPGANDPSVLKQYFAQSQLETYLGVNYAAEIKFNLLNYIYWNKDELKEFVEKAKQQCVSGKAILKNKTQCLIETLLSKEARAIGSSSLKYNRKDLRWDNYDNKIVDDINGELAATNDLFRKYSKKVILYAGILKPAEPQLTINAMTDNRIGLSFADGMMYFGLPRAFGYTDGLVPYKSAMLCDSNQSVQHDFECDSPYRIRRFEFGNHNANIRLPNTNTLSITKTPFGFNHEEMYKNIAVLQKVKDDLLSFLPKPIVPITPPPPKINIPEIPTLFLFDVSGSMNENDKIGQARASSLMAMREIQENKRLRRGDTSVSVWAFSGDCSPNSARQILPFTANLTQAENTLGTKIPRPDGGTPLPQGIKKATDQIWTYLSSRPELSEGRIILLSDGQSTCGEIRPAGIYSQTKTISDKRIRFLTIGFDVPPGSAAERDLQYLASASGGQYFPAQNQQQLIRAFEKTIRVYLPKAAANASPEFENGANAILNRNFQMARKFAVEYLQKNPADAFGYYNLAVSLEALSRYKGAAENYRKYLQFAPDAADRREIEARIEKLEQDRRDHFFYYQRLLQSDLDYLKAYYQRLFNRENEKNAVEFAGFVSEKQEFYANLTDILEIRSLRIERDAKDLSDSLGVLNRRVGLASFDRDAVSLLTIPIGHLEDIIERVGIYENQNLK